MEEFWDSVLLYTCVNWKHYQAAERYIGFVLSFLTEGSAASWRRNYIKKHAEKGTFLQQNKDEFTQEIKEEFAPTFSKEEALESLKSLRQGNTPIDTHNITFKGLVAKAGIEKEAVSLISLYQDSITGGLLARILNHEQPENLTTINDWYNKAAQHEKQWLRLRQIQGRLRGIRNDNYQQPNQNYQKKKFTPQTRTWRGLQRRRIEWTEV